jgi:hypothetical protein
MSVQLQFALARSAYGVPALGLLPLPKGEGWGEGEGIVRQPSGSPTCHSAVHREGWGDGCAQRAGRSEA